MTFSRDFFLNQLLIELYRNMQYFLMWFEFPGIFEFKNAKNVLPDQTATC